mgnify:CR=1 FL=1
MIASTHLRSPFPAVASRGVFVACLGIVLTLTALVAPTVEATTARELYAEIASKGPA